VPGQIAREMVEALEDVGLSVTAYDEGAEPGLGDGPWRIELLHEGEPDRAEVAAWLAPIAEQAGLGQLAFTLEPLAEADWLAHNAAQFPPQEAGRFWIHGSHVRQGPPDGRVPILIDAGAAFGSGDHASTRGCLLALDRLARRRRFRRVLDVGCGSGVLAIAAAKVWPARVLAVDFDPVAVRVTAENARLNGVAGQVWAAASEGFASPEVGAIGPYDLILLNILAEPLIAMAPDVARALAPGGMVVLAGLLDRQAPAVLGAYRACRLRPAFRIDLGLWATLVLKGMPGASGRLRIRERAGRPPAEGTAEPWSRTQEP
jgi:ribosomal protein L11 methyltransferase